MKILLIDDDKFFRQFYSDKLTEKGNEVIVAEDGEVGLQKVFNFSPDVILLDLIMPKKTGFEVLQDLKSTPLTSSIPVLVFSTLGQEEDIQKAKQLGANACIDKNFYDFDNLYTKILEVSGK